MFLSVLAMMLIRLPLNASFPRGKKESGIHLTEFHLSESSANSSLVIPAPATVHRD